MSVRWLYPLILAVLALPAAADGSGCSELEESSACGGDARSSTANVLFRYNGRTFLESDLTIRLRELLFQSAEKYYRERQMLMDNALWQIYLIEEAARSDRTPEQVAMELVNLTQPTEEAMQAFYQANQAQISAPYEQVKEEIAQFMIQQQALEERARLIAKIKQEGDYALLIAQPRPPINIIDSEGFPSKGPLFAPVEVVEFADYQCPHCKTAFDVMQRLEQRYRERIRVVFMDFPINRSGISLKVAEGGVCADQQDRFWDYHNAAFERQSSLSADSPTELAGKLGLDMEHFAGCMAGTEAASKVARAKAEAHRLGLDSTPTFFVNGVRLHVTADLEKTLSGAIDKALEGTES